MPHLTTLKTIDNINIEDITTESRNEYIGNLIQLDTFINTKGIADLAKVSSASVANWQTKLGAKEQPFPQPLAVEGGAKIWFKLDVTEWLANRGDAESRKREAKVASLMAQLAALTESESE